MDFIEDIAGASTPTELINALSVHAAKRDVSYLSHRTILDTGNVLHCSTIPVHWMEHY